VIFDAILHKAPTSPVHLNPAVPPKLALGGQERKLIDVASPVWAGGVIFFPALAWSPDGRQLAFVREDPSRGRDDDLYVIDLEGGVPRQLTHEPPFDGGGSWSRDGRWIYFTSDRSGRFEIWRLPSEGGPAEQLTHEGGMTPEESWDGRHVYYSKAIALLPSAIWRVPVEGGEETEAIAEPVNADDWALSRSGILYVTWREVVRRRREEFSIRFFDFESGQVTEIRRDEGPFSRWMLAVSPDEAWILYGQMPAWESELMLMENFR
jgi:dipeptidyl aminopeptidase/acylaminoacyl peptidase